MIRWGNWRAGGSYTRIMDKIAEFRSLFDCHFTPLVKYSYSITGNKEQSKDIVQNFFVDIWRSNKLAEIRSFEAFAFLSVKNKSLNYVQRRRKFDVVVPDRHVTEQQVGHDPHFPHYLLESAILGLPDKCRQVFVLSKLEGLTYIQIANKLNVSVKTVEKHVSVGLRKLKEVLLPYKEFFIENP